MKYVDKWMELEKNIPSKEIPFMFLSSKHLFVFHKGTNKIQ